MLRWTLLVVTALFGVARAERDNQWVHIELHGVGARPTAARELTPQLRRLINEDLMHTPVRAFAGAPPQGYALDGAITQLSRRNNDGVVEITCEVSLLVEQLPSHSMVMMTSSAATVQAPRASFRPEQERALQVKALEGAVHGAHETVLAYLTAQR